MTAVASSTPTPQTLVGPLGSGAGVHWALEFSGDLSKSSGKTYTSGYEIIGTWTYEIRGYYKVLGTSNVWTGKVLKGTLTC